MTQPRKIRHYGWKRQLPDWRDWQFPAVAKPVTLPPSVDLRPKDSPIYDQGQLGSCTGNATAGAVEFERRKQGLSDFVPSRLFAYYNGRALQYPSVRLRMDFRDPNAVGTLVYHCHLLEHEDGGMMGTVRVEK